MNEGTSSHRSQESEASKGGSVQANESYPWISELGENPPNSSERRNLLEKIFNTDQSAAEVRAWKGVGKYGLCSDVACSGRMSRESSTESIKGYYLSDEEVSPRVGQPKSKNTVRFVDGDVSDCAGTAAVPQPKSILKAVPQPPVSPFVTLLSGSPTENNDAAALRSSLGMADEWATSSLDQLRRERLDARAAALQDVTRSCGIQTREMYREHNDHLEQTLAEAHKRLNSGMRKLHPGHPSARKRQLKRKLPLSGQGVSESLEGILTMVVFIVLVSLLLGGMIWETHNASVSSQRSHRISRAAATSTKGPFVGTPQVKQAFSSTPGAPQAEECASARMPTTGGLPLPPPSR